MTKFDFVTGLVELNNNLKKDYKVRMVFESSHIARVYITVPDANVEFRVIFFNNQHVDSVRDTIDIRVKMILTGNSYDDDAVDVEEYVTKSYSVPDSGNEMFDMISAHLRR